MDMWRHAVVFHMDKIMAWHERLRAPLSFAHREGYEYSEVRGPMVRELRPMPKFCRLNAKGEPVLPVKSSMFKGVSKQKRKRHGVEVVMWRAFCKRCVDKPDGTKYPAKGSLVCHDMDTAERAADFLAAHVFEKHQSAQLLPGANSLTDEALDKEISILEKDLRGDGDKDAHVALPLTTTAQTERTS